MAAALGVPLVQHPVYLYDESLSLDDIMSFIIGDPRITSDKLTETHYLFFLDFLPSHLGNLSFAHHPY